MNKCWIFGSAPIYDYDFYKIPKEAFVIAADGGYGHTKRLGIIPDLVMGDFDSGEKPTESNVITAPTEKDDTDMMLAVKMALKSGYSDITLCGGLGGRLDHTFANIQTLEYICKNGGEGCIFSEDNIVMLHTAGKRSYSRINGMYFSVFSLLGESIVTITGTKYTLNEHLLSSDFPLGVSNEIIEDHAEVDLMSGKLLIIYSKK